MCEKSGKYYFLSNIIGELVYIFFQLKLKKIIVAVFMYSTWEVLLNNTIYIYGVFPASIVLRIAQIIGLYDTLESIDIYALSHLPHDL